MIRLLAALLFIPGPSFAAVHVLPARVRLPVASITPRLVLPRFQLSAPTAALASSLPSLTPSLSVLPVSAAALPSLKVAPAALPAVQAVPAVLRAFESVPKALKSKDARRAPDTWQAVFDGVDPEIGTTPTPVPTNPRALIKEGPRVVNNLVKRLHKLGVPSGPGKRRRSPAAVDYDLMSRRVAAAPPTNRTREREVVRMFKEAGASAQDVRLQEVGPGEHNIFVVKPGRTNRVIVVSAHHDKVGPGGGVIDNWTGTTMVANLFQTLGGIDTEASYVFMVFAGEEQQVRGSKAFVSSLSRDERYRVDAVVNLDSLAVDGILAWYEGSDNRLIRRAHEAASGAGESLEIWHSVSDLADSAPFLDEDIAAITIAGITKERAPKVINSAADTIERFDPDLQARTYGVVLRLLRSLDVTAVSY